jgi:hypothetical protein
MAAALGERKIDASSMLRPTVRTTVVKTNSLGHVLPEPVKCAVVRQGLADASHATSSLMSARKVERLSASKHPVPVEQFKASAAATSLPVGTVIPMPYVGPKQVTSALAKTQTKQHGVTDSKPVLIAVKSHTTDSVKKISEVDDGVTISSDLVTCSAVHSSDEVTVPATLDTDGGMDRLENEVSILKDQLEIQLKVSLILITMYQVIEVCK